MGKFFLRYFGANKAAPYLKEQEKFRYSFFSALASESTRSPLGEMIQSMSLLYTRVPKY